MMAIVDVDVQGQTVKAWITLVQKDGTVSERGIKNIQDVMELQGWDWTMFENPHSFAGRRCEVVLEAEPDQNGELRQKVKWLNVPGGGVVKSADPKAMAAKYAAKFRAICGGTPATRPAGKPMEQPNLPQRGAAPQSTMEACWEGLRNVMPGQTDKAVESAWFRLIDKIGAGKEAKEMTPAEWGKAMALIKSVKPVAAAPAPEPPPPAPEPEPAADEDNLPF